MAFHEYCNVDVPHGRLYEQRKMKRIYVRKAGGKGFEAIGWICRLRHLAFDKETP